MKRTHTPSSALVDESVRRLWTGETEARNLLKDGQDLDGILMQHARVADSITKQGGKNSRVRRFRISTETQDRHGDIIRTKGILLKNFRKNPVVLFAHDSFSPPIGKSPSIKLGDRFVDADVDFFDFETFEFADTIFRIVDKGGLRATSIGFMPLKHERMEEDDPDNLTGARFAFDFKRIDLLEFSIVPVPANPEAVRAVAKSGAQMAPYKDWLEDMQDNWDHTGEFMKDLGLEEGDFDACRAAINGTSVAVQMPEDWGDEEEDSLQELQILDVDSNIENIMLHEDRHEYPGTDDIRIVELQGTFPERTAFAVELVDAGKEGDHLCRKDDHIFLHLDNASADYLIETETDDTIIGTLVKCDYAGSISWFDAHKDGTAKQGQVAKWNGSREEKAAVASVDLKFMAAWKGNEDEPKYKFIHHAVGNAEEPYPVNYRALVTCMAKLLGADGGSDIPDADRKCVWNHLSRHLRDDFDTIPPELRWVGVQPLKEYPELCFFDHSSAQLLIRNSVTEEEGAPPTFIDSRGVSTSEDGEFVFPEVSEKQYNVHTLSTRQRKWDDLAQFKAWITDEGFEVDEETGFKITRHFWRMAQLKGTQPHDVAIISLYPNDVDVASPECIVSASLVLVKSPDEQIDKDSTASKVPQNFALLKDGSVKVGVDEELTQDDGDAKHMWALMIAGDPLQVIGLKAVTSEEADTAARQMVKSLESVMYLGRFAGTQDDGTPVYADYAMYRLKDGVVIRQALDDEAIDEIQDFVDGMNRLKVIVSDLSEGELAQLASVKDWLDEVFADDNTDDDLDDADDGEDELEGLLVQSLEDGELPDDIYEAVKDVVLGVTEEAAKQIVDTVVREEVGQVD